MTTVRETITDAMRMINVLAGGREPRAADATLGLRRFQSMLVSLPTFSHQLSRVRISSAYTAEENQRIFSTTGSAQTITLPDAVDDTDNEIPNDPLRPPVNGAMVAESNNPATVSIYVEYIGEWRQLTGLTLDSGQPLGDEHDEGVAAMLAVRLSPYFGVSVPPATALMASEGRSHIRQRFRQPVIVTTDPLLLSRRDRAAIQTLT